VFGDLNNRLLMAGEPPSPR